MIFNNKALRLNIKLLRDNIYIYIYIYIYVAVFVNMSLVSSKEKHLL
jgi:hypothetical protein